MNFNDFEFVIGSTSTHKYYGVLEALNRFGFSDKALIPVDVDSGVGAQPCGHGEILEGAMNRAINAYRVFPNSDAFIGIENGIEKLDDQWLDYAIIFLMVPSASFAVWDKTTPIVFPEWAVLETQGKPWGFTKNTVAETLLEAGSIVDAKDPHVTLGRRPRSAFIRDTMIRMLKHLNEDL